MGEQCENEMVGNYVQALFMVVQHYFVDGAAHICQAAGICDVKGLWEPQPRPYTCEECVQGLELVGQYMVDPLWVADFTLYLELNFCVGPARLSRQGQGALPRHARHDHG